MEKMLQTLMLEEHDKIRNLLKDCEKSLQDSKNTQLCKDLFGKLKWNLEKHFFIEEKAIFNFYNDITGDDVEHMFKLMEEHGQVIELVKNIEDGLSNNQAVEIFNLIILLNHHSKFEDEVFYPKLDDSLNPEQKQEIRNRVEEILRG